MTMRNRSHAEYQPKNSRKASSGIDASPLVRYAMRHRIGIATQE